MRSGRLPGWLSVLLGVVSGLAVIAGAVYLAVRPYLRADHKPWLPEPHRDPPRNNSYTD